MVLSVRLRGPWTHLPQAVWSEPPRCWVYSRLQRRGSYEVLVKASLRGLLAAALGRQRPRPLDWREGWGSWSPTGSPDLQRHAHHSHVRPGTGFQTLRWEASRRQSGSGQLLRTAEAQVMERKSSLHWFPYLYLKFSTEKTKNTASSPGERVRWRRVSKCVPWDLLDDGSEDQPLSFSAQGPAPRGPT